MTTAYPNQGRFDDVAEPKARCDARGPFVPATAQERHEQSIAMGEIARIARHLEAINKARERLEKLPPVYLNELDGRLPNFPILDPDADDVDAARQLSDELEAGLDEWEGYS